VTERIERLRQAGQLAEIEPDREYGYTSRIVFGVLISEIAASDALRRPADQPFPHLPDR